MLVIGRTPALRQPRLGLGGHLLLQHLHQARFANARLAAEQHHLPQAVLDLRPALQQQPHFLLPPHQRGQARCCRPLPGDCCALLSSRTR